MCGRYTLYHSTNEIIERFKIQQSKMGIDPRYNVAPSQLVAVIAGRTRDDSSAADSRDAESRGTESRGTESSDTESSSAGGVFRTLEPVKWGLVPFWVKDINKHKPFINARCETLAEKPSFKAALSRRRCIIPADGFFEWKKTEHGKIPMYITVKGGKPFALAGIWEEWTAPDGTPLRTCAIITVPANEFMEDIHDRMPAILTPEAEDVWLDPAEKDRDKLLKLLVPFDSAQMEAHPVGKIVNSPIIDSEECIKEVDQESIIADAMGSAGGRTRRPSAKNRAEKAESGVAQLKLLLDE